MKRSFLLFLLTFATFNASPAQDKPKAKPEEPACCMMKVGDSKASDATVEKLTAAMNGSIGDEKVAAMAALLNHLVQERKAMKEKMAMCEKMMADKAAKAEGAPLAPADPHAKHH